MQDGFWWGLLAGFAAATAIGAAAGGHAYRLAARRAALLESLARRADRRAERMAELGALTGGLAHEIKNPLSTVGLNLQLLREDVADLPPARDGQLTRRLLKRIDTVAAEAARLRQTLDDFLRYAGRLEVERAPTDLNRLLEELVDFFSPQAQLARVRLRLTVPPSPVVIAADGKLIKQAVLNLLLNAVQAMPGGGDLTLTLSEAARQATIDVADTGPGVPPGEREKIFAAYYTRRKGGTGLGLPMSRRIAEEHGGTLDVAGGPGEGARFTLSLPVDVGEPPRREDAKNAKSEI